MAMQREYTADAPAREDVDALPGATVVEFGTNWCGHCTAAQPLIAGAFASHANVRHFKVEDGPGRRLGRSYRVKLWPTLVLLRNGEEVTRLVRPTAQQAVDDALAMIDPEESL
ncbi:thioredoxin domain-containing protein [Lysobacter sp. F6437]|uniref:thioredoxin domain-containing protein n=1 Tax=Lysobacter sp. F6437 TaxID=3459296 RepID=UPI00403E0168